MWSRIFKVAAGLLVLSGGYVWTVGQSGLNTTNQNLCDLANSLSPLTFGGCKVQLWIVALWAVVCFAALCYLVLVGIRETPEALQRLNKVGPPVYLIILGILITLGGTVWLVFAQSVAATSQASVANTGAATPLADTEKKSDKPPLPGSAAVAPISARQLYRLTNNDLSPDSQSIVRRTDGAFIPPDLRNSDFQRYSDWRAAGNVPDRAEATLPPKYSPRSPTDADREIPIVDKLVAILDKEITLPNYRLNELMMNWQDALAPNKSEAYFKEWDFYREQLDELHVALATALNQIPQFCDDDLCHIIEVRKIAQFGDMIQKALIPFRHLSHIVDPQKFKRDEVTALWLPPFQQLVIAQSAFGEWRAWTTRLLKDRRRELSEIASRKG